MFRSKFPSLRLNRPLLRGEALAGLTVGLVVIPQGVAYAALAGMPLVTGIYASFLPALVAVLFSASPRLSVGPTALTCLLVSASLSSIAEPGSPQWVALAVWLALLSGLLQVGLGLVRVGWLLNLVNSPVLMAFTQAAAVLIIASQLPAMLGFPNWEALSSPASFHWPALLFGVISLAVLMLARRWRPDFPAVLMVVVVGGAISYFSGFEAAGGAVIGTLPRGLPMPYWPDWPGWATLAQLIVPTMVISLVSFLETAASAKIDNGQRGQRWDQNRDLIGQGLAKLVSGLSGAFPTSSSFSRSALNLYAGAKTGWATVFCMGVVLIALLLLTPLLHHVPMAVLSAIVLVAVIGLIRPRVLLRLWTLSRVEAVIAAVTFIATVLAAPRMYWGVFAGVLMALAHFLYLRLHPRIVEVGLHQDGSLRDREAWSLPPLAPGLYALRMDAALDFTTANALEQAVADYVSQHPGTRHVMLVAHPINRVDTTGIESFGRLMNQLGDQQIALHVVGMKLPVERALRAAGYLETRDGLSVYRTEADALKFIEALNDAAAKDGQDAQGGGALA